MCTTATLYTHKDVFFVCFVQMCQCRLNIVAFECACIMCVWLCVCVRACVLCVLVPVCVCVCTCCELEHVCVCVCARGTPCNSCSLNIEPNRTKTHTHTHKHTRLQRNHLDNAFGPYNPLQATAEFQRLPELQSAAPGAACKSCEIPPL